MAIKVDKLLITHLVLPLLALSVVSIVILMGDIDRIVADYIYAAQGNTWVWKNHWLMESVFHKGGRNLSLLLALIVIVLLCISYVHHSLAPYKKSLLYLVLATAGSSLLVSFFKSSLAVSCPWEFAHYGGSLDYHTVLEQIFLRNGEGCFPAGHASAGYAWISLYFIGIHYQSRWRWVGLIISLLAGLLFGIAQQLRGAHFISHDLWTLAICWLLSLSLFLVFFRSSTNRQLLLEPLCP